ncbi:MAG: hypothetical protein AAF519_11570 [Bacteroidota bacterium]
MAYPSFDFPWPLEEAYDHYQRGLKKEFTEQGLHHANIHAVENMDWLARNITHVTVAGFLCFF